MMAEPEIDPLRRILFATPLAGLLLAACQPSEQKIAATPARLDCPTVQGELKRTAQAPDGQSCAYTTGATEVTLRLLPVSGDPEAALRLVENDLRLLKPIVLQKIDDPEPVEPAAPAEPAAPPAPPEPPAPSGVDVDVDVNVDADPGETVQIDIPGLKIHANDAGAKLRIAGVDIDASDNGAEIRRVAYNRLPGEQLSREKRGFSGLFILAGEPSGPDGYSFVGYDAKGPRNGPLTVAVIKSRERGEVRYDSFNSDIKALMKRNGGG